MRAKAKAAGNLKSGPQITVVQQSPQTIVIQPTNPQIVYVPHTTLPLFTALPMSFPATPLQMSLPQAFFPSGLEWHWSDDRRRCGWGYSSWNCNWYGGGAYYHGGAYYGNDAWHGGYYGTSGWPMDHTAARTIALAITLPPGLTRAARQLDRVWHAKGRTSL